MPLSRNPEPTHRRLVVALASALLLAGCVKPALMVASNEQAQLGPDEALLAVEAESRTKWDQLVVKRRGDGKRFSLALAGDGDRLGVYKLPAGEYTLVGAHLPLAYTKDRTFKEELKFALRAGHLNYIGTLGFWFDNDGALFYQWRNRSGRVLTGFRAMLPASADRLPFAYVGEEGDDWSSAMGGAK
jgi:hypothetical protein